MIAREIVNILEDLCPIECACSWDNPGMHIGHLDKEVNTVLIVVDCDDAAVTYAIANNVDMIIAHHPLLFGGIKQINDDSVMGKRVLSLIENGINCYCMHTNFDIAGGMAEEAAVRIGLIDCEPLEEVNEAQGIGKVGKLVKSVTVADLCATVKNAFGLTNVILYGEKDDVVSRVAISPGSGKDMIALAKVKGAEVLITGDITYHYGIDAVADGLRIIDAGHYGIEHIFIKLVNDYLDQMCSSLKIIPMPINNPQKVL